MNDEEVDVPCPHDEPVPADRATDCPLCVLERKNADLKVEVEAYREQLDHLAAQVILRLCSCGKSRVLNFSEHAERCEALAAMDEASS